MSVCPCGRQTRRTERSVAVERFDGAGNRLPAVVYCASCSARIWQACDDHEQQKRVNRSLGAERTAAMRAARDWPPSSQTRIMRVQVRDPALVLEAVAVCDEALTPE